MAPSMFPQFSSHRMPGEIKDMIWTYAISQIPPRIIKMYIGSSTNEDKDTGGTVSVLGYASSAQTPSILNVCSRSRILAQKRWSLAFRIAKHFDQLRKPRCILETGSVVRGEDVPTIWTDFDGDTLLCFERIHLTDADKNIPMPIFSKDVDVIERTRVKKLWLDFDYIAMYEEDAPRSTGLEMEKFETAVLGYVPEEKSVFKEVDDEWIMEAMNQHVIGIVEDLIYMKSWDILVEDVGWKQDMDGESVFYLKV